MSALTSGAPGPIVPPPAPPAAHLARLITVSCASPTSRIILRSPKASDAHSLTQRAHDPACTAFLPHIANSKKPITVASNLTQIANWRADSRRGEGWFFVVVLKAGVGAGGEETSEEAAGDMDWAGGIPGDVLATIGETGMGPFAAGAPPKRAETGVMLASGPRFRGRGYAVEALDMVFEFGFEHLGLEEIFLGTHKDNEPMRGLMERRFGVPAVWREEQGDWRFTVGREWWERRQSERGERLVLVVEGMEDDGN